MFNGMVRELKEVRYIPQLKRNLISVGALKTLGLVVSIRDGVLKMTKGSMVAMKGVRRNNLYYLRVIQLQVRWRLLFLQMMFVHKFSI